MTTVLFPSREVPRQGFVTPLFDPQALSSLGPSASLYTGAAWPSASYPFLSSNLSSVPFSQNQAGLGLDLNSALTRQTAGGQSPRL